MKKVFLLFVASVIILLFNINMVFAETYDIYTYNVTEGEVTIVKCDNTASGDIIIPEKIGGMPVTVIGGYAFYKCEGITSVVIPDSVKAIKNEAFYRCTNLASVIIPDGIKDVANSSFMYTAIYANESNWENDLFYIGNYLMIADMDIEGACRIKQGTKYIANSALGYCDITSVEIPDSVEIIGARAFLDCALLTEINIPKGVKAIGEDAFMGCDGLTSITIPDSVTVVGAGAFSNCPYVTTASIGNGVSSLESEVFANNTRLEKVTIGSGITSINTDAFLETGKLIEFEVDENNQSYTTIDGVLCSKDKKTLVSFPKGRTGEYTVPDCINNIGEKAFYSFPGVISVILGSNVESIGAEAFKGCRKLESITMSEGLKQIGDNAFYSCKKLKSVAIPDSVESLGTYCFACCWELTSAKIGKKVNELDGTFYDTGLTSVQIPESITQIGNSAFEWCTKLVSVIFPESITKIGPGAFANCTSLESITIPREVTEIGGRAFYKCEGLTSIVIPDDVTQIGARAFCDCIGLGSIQIPEGVKVIGAEAFYNTEYYNDSSNWADDVLYIDNHLIRGNEKINGSCRIKPDTKSIADCAFDECIKLVSVIIPEGIENIGRNTFSECRRLNCVVIPASVKKISMNAFNMGVRLGEVYYSGTESEWEEVEIEENNEDLLEADIIYMDRNASGIYADGTIISVVTDDSCAGKQLVVAVYNGDSLVEVFADICRPQMVYETFETYTDVKVMVWDNLSAMSSACEAEKLFLQ